MRGLILLLGLLAISTVDATLWGLKKIKFGATSGDLPAIYALNPVDGSIMGTVNLQFPGNAAFNPVTDQTLGMSWDPITQQLFAVVQLNACSCRKLVKINRSTGAVTVVGDLSWQISSIAFSCDGILYGVTGDTDDELIWINPSVLFEIDPLTATASELFMLGNGTDGEAIDFDCTNGLIYHWSGHIAVSESNRIFESVAVTCADVQGIPITKLAATPVLAEVHSATWVKQIGAFIVTDDRKQIGKLTRDGVWTYYRTLSTWVRGLADDQRAPLVQPREVVMHMRLPSVQVASWDQTSEATLVSGIATALAVVPARVNVVAALRDTQSVFVTANVVNVTKYSSDAIVAAAGAMDLSAPFPSWQRLDVQSVCGTAMLPACAIEPRLVAGSPALYDIKALAEGFLLDTTASQETLIEGVAAALADGRLMGGSSAGDTGAPRPAVLASVLLDRVRARSLQLRSLCAGFRIAACAAAASQPDAASLVARAIQTLVARRC